MVFYAPLCELKFFAIFGHDELEKSAMELFSPSNMIAIGAGVIALVSLANSIRKDTKLDATELATMKVKIDYIESQQERMQKKFEDIDRKLDDLKELIIRRNEIKR